MINVLVRYDFLRYNIFLVLIKINIITLTHIQNIYSFMIHPILQIVMSYIRNVLLKILTAVINKKHFIFIFAIRRNIFEMHKTR